jgi:acyl-CoA reductase-like NAD-dependent aldehyde dehydrogenase
MATTTTTVQLCKNFIGGEWVDSKSTHIFERRNPANREDTVARIALSTRQEMKEAIVAAKAAYPAWRETPAPTRGKILFIAARIMQD